MSLMQRMTQQLQRGHAEASATLNTVASRRQRGASAIEYVIIAAVIAFAIFLAAGANDGALATAFTDFFSEITTIVDEAPDE
ncbi:MAG: Flp family type IVb pilin [Pseudomonadota bacterium]